MKTNNVYEQNARRNETKTGAVTPTWFPCKYTKLSDTRSTSEEEEIKLERRKNFVDNGTFDFSFQTLMSLESVLVFVSTFFLLTTLLSSSSKIDWHELCLLL